MALINKNALKEKSVLKADTKFFILDPNTNQANAGNETITWENVKAEIASEQGAFTDVISTSDTTDATTKDTGSIITEGGIGVEKSIGLGADLLLEKEVNHNITISASTTADTAGGDLTIAGGAGLGTGTGGDVTVVAGAGGATGAGATVYITSGEGGATSGNAGYVIIAGADAAGTAQSGYVEVKTGTAESANTAELYVHTGNVSVTGNSGDVTIVTGNTAIGTTGDITLTTGNSASGLSGDIILTTGTETSATVEPCIQLAKAVVRKPKSSGVASGGTITGPELVGGLIAATGATGNWQLPTAAQITTAIGSTPTGTTFEFIFNAQAMTATNVATLLVGANMTVMSAPAITGGATLTVAQDTQSVGVFRIVYDTATTCKISRIA